MILRLAALALVVTAASLHAQATRPAVLVELFTSEGCSSCPPADALLREINGKQAAAGQLLVGLSEHVTYWNRLGWTDPFSAETYTDRQSGYSRRFHLEGVYTPQMVVNGTAQFTGSDRAALDRALSQQPAKPGIPLKILAAGVTGAHLHVTFAAGPAPTPAGAELIAVVTDDLDRSGVLRGENAGRNLAHAAVARVLLHVATLHAATQQKVDLPIPDTLNLAAGSHHLILFAQSPGFGPVLATDSQPIAP